MNVSKNWINNKNKRTSELHFKEGSSFLEIRRQGYLYFACFVTKYFKNKRLKIDVTSDLIGIYQTKYTAKIGTQKYIKRLAMMVE